MRTLCKWSRNALRQKKSHLTSFMGFRTILSTSLILSMPGKRSAMSRRILPWKRCTRQKTRAQVNCLKLQKRIVFGRANFLAWRKIYPASLEFEIRRIRGRGDFWVVENSIRYDGEP